jgi:hypothetical protein
MTNVNEIWLPIPNYEGLYEISNYGRVKSFLSPPKKNKVNIPLKEGKIINPFYDKKKYLKLHLTKNKNPKTFLVHRLVMLAFVGESKLAVDHIDGNKENNYLSNLRYCTNRENSIYYYEKKEGKSSKRVGVSYSKDRKKWCSFIRINKKQLYLGAFNSEEEAEKKYLEAKKNIVC